MTQSDLNVANAPGATVRADINTHLDVLASQSAGATAPSTTFPNQSWFDTTLNLLKQRNNANTAWVVVAAKDGTNWTPYYKGFAFPAAVNEVSPKPFRNEIINGAMKVSARGEGVAIVTASDFATGPYGPDRFKAESQGSPQFRGDLEHVTTGGPSEFPNFLRVDVTTAEAAVATTEAVYVQQRIEAQNLQRLLYGTGGARSLALTFYMRSPKTGIHCVGMHQADATRSHVKEFTIVAANTWEQFTLVFPGDTGGTINDDNGEGLRVIWPIIAGSNFQVAADAWATGLDFATSNQQILADNVANNVDITGIQLEVVETGAIDGTDFEHLPIDVEELRCKRYYERQSADGDQAFYGSGMAYGTTTGEIYWQFTVQKRITPVVDKSADGDFQLRRANAGLQDVTGLAPNLTNRNGIQLAMTTASGLAAGDGMLLLDDGNFNSWLSADAEL